MPIPKASAAHLNQLRQRAHYLGSFSVPLPNPFSTKSNSLQPVIDFLNLRMPIISDLFGQSVTPLQFADDLGKYVKSIDSDAATADVDSSPRRSASSTCSIIFPPT